jgi:aspartyl-tRNA(Asn)/glutamyl-tRNA(Gln) amidotransferase subunit B
MVEYEAVIGLETHIQLNTETKLFCGCKADSWFDPPNTNICPVCTGMPGVLPVLNKRAVGKGMLLAHAMHAEIQPVSYFDRKNYFYPDLPKGYQISQFDIPLAKGGYLDLPIPGKKPEEIAYTRRVNIIKLHVEEDAGKTKNIGGKRYIDFNRCGVPLVEMVTGPDLRTADEAAQYLIRLRQLLRWLGISEGDMERGQLRCDGNVSIRPKGADFLNPKTEIKNVNSIDSLRDAIRHEIDRQIRQVEAGGSVEAWTLEWDEDAQVLRKMRSKETEADYRYFREPDLLPLHVSEKWRDDVLENFPELPLERRQRFVGDYKLSAYDAEILTQDLALADYFEAAVGEYAGEPKKIANWMINELLHLLSETGAKASELKVTPAQLAGVIQMVDKGEINASAGKLLISEIQRTGKPAPALVTELGLGLVSDEDQLRALCTEVIEGSPAQVESYRSGKVGLLGWFMGQVMKKSNGKADPAQVRRLLAEMLDR